MPNWEANNKIISNSIVIEVDNPSILEKDRDILSTKRLYRLKIANYIANVLSSLSFKTVNGNTITGSGNINTKITSFATVTTTSIFPNVDVVFFGAGVNNRIGTIPTSLMSIGQIITVKRAVGATGVLTLLGQSGQIQALANTLGATTTLAAAGSLGQAADFLWNGANLLRINNG